VRIERFGNRAEAGRLLAQELAVHAGRENVIVLALPRGGVPVAYEVAQALGAPLDVFVVRKLGAPHQRELAMGAIASGGVRVVDESLVRRMGLSAREVEEVAAQERIELERRERLYRGGGQLPDLRGKTVIVVDDGLATGATLSAAARALRRLGPKSIVAAVPVGAPEACAALAGAVDACVCLRRPSRFEAVGLWYDDFAQTTDEEVLRLLERARALRPSVQSSNSTLPWKTNG
jgi:putative phosphoribosyl transferase